MAKVDECTGVVLLSERRMECRISNQCRSYLVLGGQYCLSLKAGNVGRERKCALEASEGLCWSGGVLPWLLLLTCSSCLFVMP